MATNRLYLGNLPYNSTNDDIIEFLAPRKVLDVKIITDRDTGQSRGFAFAQLEDHAAVLDAVAALDRTELGGRTIVVNEAKDKPNHSNGGRGNGRGRDRDRGNRRDRRYDD